MNAYPFVDLEINVFQHRSHTFNMVSGWITNMLPRAAAYGAGLAALTFEAATWDISYPLFTAPFALVSQTLLSRGLEELSNFARVSQRVADVWWK